MKQFFILGHNPELSAAEIFSFLEKNRIKFNSKFVNDGLIVDFESKINIQELGGTKAIGRVLCEGDVSDVKKFIEKNEIYLGERTNFTYFLYGNTDILDAIKEKLRKEKLKARYSTKMGSDFSWFYVSGYFGVVEQVYDTASDAARDMKKPVRRSQLAIPPRLARILVNLAQVKKGEKILDCFCGIGVILQEALLLGIDTMGVDIDKKAVFGCKKNLEWLKKNYKIKNNWKLENADSGKIKLEKVDGVACEPSLGMLLEKNPPLYKAEDMIDKFQHLMILVLGNIKKYIRKDSKIVFTSPVISTNKGDLSIDIDYILNKTGLRLYRIKGVEIPIFEARKGQLVGREIYILEN